MKLSKEKFLKTELGSEMEACIISTSTTQMNIRETEKPPTGVRLNGKYTRWPSGSFMESNTASPGRMNTSGL